MRTENKRLTDERKAKIADANRRNAVKRKAVREGSRIECADFVMFFADEYNWVVCPKGTDDYSYFSEPGTAAIELLRRTTDRHLTRTKAATIADLRACMEKAKADVVAAIRKVEDRLF